MEVHQTTKSSCILYRLEIYSLKDKTRQRRHQVNFEGENIKKNAMLQKQERKQIAF